MAKNMYHDRVYAHINAHIYRYTYTHVHTQAHTYTLFIHPRRHHSYQDTEHLALSGPCHPLNGYLIPDSRERQSEICYLSPVMDVPSSVTL